MTLLVIKELLELQLEHAIVGKYQAVARRKSRGSQIWYYVLFIIVWRPPIPFCGWIGDTFKINHKVRSLIDEMLEFFHHRQLSGLIFINYHWISIEYYWEDVFSLDFQGKVKALRVYLIIYFERISNPHTKWYGRSLHDDKQNLVPNFLSSNFSSRTSSILAHDGIPQLQIKQFLYNQKCQLRFLGGVCLELN